MSGYLPPNLLRLFVPRPELPKAAPLVTDKDPSLPPKESKRIRPLEGVASYLERARQDAADKGEATEGAEDEQVITLAESVKKEMMKETRRKRHEENRKRGENECRYYGLAF